MLCQPLAERLALPRVGERCVERGARDADRLRGDADPPAVEAGKRDLQSAPRLAQQVLGRNLEILELDLASVVAAMAELVLDAQHIVTGLVGARQEGRDAALACVR